MSADDYTRMMVARVDEAEGEADELRAEVARLKEENRKLRAITPPTVLEILDSQKENPS